MCSTKAQQNTRIRSSRYFSIKKNLAFLYQTKHKYDEARKLYKECLAKREMIAGLNDPKNNLAILYKIQVMYNEAEFHFSQGKFDEAEPLYKECVAKRESILGLDHPDTMQSINSLTDLYLWQSRYVEAMPLLEFSLSMFQLIHGLDHPESVLLKQKWYSYLGKDHIWV